MVHAHGLRLLAQEAGQGPAITSEDPTERVLEAERMYRAHSVAPETRATFDRLAALEPRLLASMHGSSFEGDGAGVLRGIGAGLETLATEVARGAGSPGILEAAAAPRMH